MNVHPSRLNIRRNKSKSPMREPYRSASPAPSSPRPASPVIMSQPAYIDSQIRILPATTQFLCPPQMARAAPVAVCQPRLMPLRTISPVQTRAT
jgi:hypothetical protein